MNDITAALADLLSRVEGLEEALTNQEETIREQEKLIVTLQLQVQGLQDARG